MSVPREFVTWDREPPQDARKACGTCGSPRFGHSGARCGLCGDSVEHHDEARQNGSEPLRFEECLAGAYRMAKARHMADVELTERDRLVLAYYG